MTDRSAHIGRTLSVDFGTKRIGLAISDELGLLASPLRTVTVSATARMTSAEVGVAAVAEVARTENAARLLVGLPLNMDDSEGPAAKSARHFGRALAERTGLPVEFWDERLSSFAAEAAMRPAELTRQKKKQHLDSVAAQIILSDWLEAHRARPQPPVEPPGEAATEDADGRDEPTDNSRDAEPRPEC